MRRDMQEIVPNVFLGPYCVANKKRLDYLLGHGISHIICIRHPMEANIIKPNFLDRIKYLVLDIIDSPSDNIITFFPQIKQYIDEALQAGGKVLMHGNAGISRSATFMIAYLMETYGQTYRDAFFYVQQKRSASALTTDSSDNFWNMSQSILPNSNLEIRIQKQAVME